MVANQEIAIGARLLHSSAALAAVLTALVAAVAFFATAKPYESRGSLLAVNTQSSNPYLSSGRGVYAVCEVVQEKLLNDPATTATIRALGGSATYTAQIDDSINEPILVVSATAAQPAVAQQALKVLVAAANSQLIAVQAAVGAPSATYIRFQAIAYTPTAQMTRREAITKAIELGAATFPIVFALGASVRARPNKGRKRPSNTDANATLQTRQNTASMTAT